MIDTWNTELYDAKHSFVWKLGSSVVELLAPQPGERIGDLGCGTGQLTAQIFFEQVENNAPPTLQLENFRHLNPPSRARSLLFSPRSLFNFGTSKTVFYIHARSRLVATDLQVNRGGLFEDVAVRR